MGNKHFKDCISLKRDECILMFNQSRLRSDQIVIFLNIDKIKNKDIAFNNLSFDRCPNCRTRNDFYLTAINFIRTCDEDTLDLMINYLKNLNTDNDITGETVHN